MSDKTASSTTSALPAAKSAGPPLPSGPVLGNGAPQSTTASSNTMPSPPSAGREKAADLRIREWEWLAMVLSRLWMNEDEMTQRIVQQHMHGFDAARAFGVVSRFSPARQNELRADTKLGGKGVEYVTANMARWVALFRAGPSMQGHRVPFSTTESEASQARGRQSGVRAEAPQAGRSSSVPVVPSVETGDGARAGNASNQGRSAAQSVPMTSAHRAPTDDSRSQPARPVRDESEVLYDHIKHSPNDVDFTMPFSSPDLETETPKQDMKKPPFRLPKWPLSHSERISELEEQLPFYANTNQAKNIIAAIKYHFQYQVKTWYHQK